jgi:anti-sigma B factor antagonist
VEQEGAGAALRLAGEFDVSCEHAFMDAATSALEDDTRELLVDLRGLSFIDSSGLRMLIQLWMESRRGGFELSILQGNGQVRRTLEIAGLDRVLPIADTGSSQQ